MGVVAVASGLLLVVLEMPLHLLEQFPGDDGWADVGGKDDTRRVILCARASTHEDLQPSIFTRLLARLGDGPVGDIATDIRRILSDTIDHGLGPIARDVETVRQDQAARGEQLGWGGHLLVREIKCDMLEFHPSGDLAKDALDDGRRLGIDNIAGFAAPLLRIRP